MRGSSESTMVATARRVRRHRVPTIGNQEVIGVPESAKDSRARADETPAMSDASSTPIAGVDLATYAWVVKQIARFGFDHSLLPGFAAQRGIAATDWQAAIDGWSMRLGDPGVASSFRTFYDAS
jgi:hypothetical protein